jgi:hypothetical protein
MYRANGYDDHSTRTSVVPNGADGRDAGARDDAAIQHRYEFRDLDNECLVPPQSKHLCQQ